MCVCLDIVMTLLYLVVLLLVMGICHAFPTGAPEETCTSLYPNHGYQHENTTAPVKITTDKNTYQSGDTIQGMFIRY